MDEAHLKRTPLFECHVEAKARIVPFAGFEMPVQYTGVLDEHRAVRTAVGLFDVSHMGEVDVVGRRALDFVQYVTCNDASKLAVGRAQYSGLMTPRGTFVDDLLVHKISDERYFLVVNAANKDKDYAYLCAQAVGFDGVEVRDRSDDYAQIAVQGPKALPTLQKLTPAALAEIKYYRFVNGEVDGAEAIISRTGYTGEDGFEVYVAPGDAARIWRALLAAGKEFGIMPAGLGARDTLRFEACMALYGNDIDDSTTPFEAGLGWIVKLDKGGFLGREALVRQQGDGIRRKLVGFEMTGRGIARHGYPIWASGKEVGAVTSGTHSPTLGKPLGMGYVPVELAGLGSVFDVEIRDQKVAARVVEMPFYRRAR
ncbi:MAG TPA: glycine cleavage system aminomethyltransferase GcvT [Thermoanaerobaculaceae bacterium]|nr:glycine cleavage system aminomethyltransferase GcvT [Thermoanaerobaculaceae bacterium]